MRRAAVPPGRANVGIYAPGSSTASQSRTAYRLYSGQSVSLGSTISCSSTAPTALPCATVDANGIATQLNYDSAGDITAASTPDGNAGETATTSFAYDDDGELTSQTTPNGNLPGADQAKYTTTYIYDDDGRLSSRTVSTTAGAVVARTTGYGYDANGNRTAITDARGKRTDVAFDANDRAVFATDPNGSTTLTCYDGEGHVAQVVPPVGVASESLTASSCPTSYPTGYGARLADQATSYSYNARGLKVGATTPAPNGVSGPVTTSYEYDSADRLLNITAPPASNSPGAPSQVTRYIYDDAGHLASVVSGFDSSAASTRSYCYDPNGTLTAEVAPNGNVTGTASCSGSAPYTTGSSYETTYVRDSVGQLVSVRRPATSAAVGGQTTSFTYDVAGNRLTSTDPNGVTKTLTYTPLGNVATVGYSGSSASGVSFTYDANGNQVSMTDGTGSSTSQYDPFNELVSHTDGSGKTVAYSYDPTGNLTQISYPLGSAAWASSNTVNYAYDDAGVLNAITDFNNNTIGLTSTRDGLPETLTLAGTGATITYQYGAADAAGQITVANGSTTTLRFSYTDAPSGVIAGETDTPTSPISPAAYSYDEQSRLTQFTPGSSAAAPYGFDPDGNLTTLPTGASASYDAADELTAATLGTTTISFSYDANGSRTAAAIGGSNSAMATYNGAAQLVSYTTGATSMTSAAYDGSGLRTSAGMSPTGGGSSTNTFTWDTSAGTPHLLLDSANAYIYGPGDQPIEQVDLSSGARTYLIADRLGSIRATIDSSGTVSGSASYTPWGSPQGGGLTTTPFGFAGGYTDPTGLIYLINRYYDPETGQFLTVDPIVDETGYAYTYANGNPTNVLDPLGLTGFGDIYNGFAHAVGAAVSAVDPLSTSNLFYRAAGSGSPWASVLKFNPAFQAIDGYANAWQAWERGCSFWVVGGYAAQGTLGVAGTVAGGGAGIALARAITTAVARDETGVAVVTLYRAVGSAEAQSIRATGNYSIGGSSAEYGKYFYPTAKQAQALVQRGWATELTSARFPSSVMKTAEDLGQLPGEGQAYFLPRKLFPHGPVDMTAR